MMFNDVVYHNLPDIDCASCSNDSRMRDSSRLRQLECDYMTVGESSLRLRTTEQHVTQYHQTVHCSSSSSEERPQTGALSRVMSSDVTVSMATQHHHYERTL